MWKRIIGYLLATLALLVALALLLFGKSDIPVEVLSEKYANAPSRFTEVQGMKVHYRDEGPANDTLPIVLLHGTGASLHTFDAWTRELSQVRRVIRLDLPAFGLTGPFPTRDYSMESFTLFLSDFLDRVGVDKAVVAGNSFGGQIAWNFTLAHPDRVKKLVLIDASGYPSKSKSRPIAFRIAEIPVLNKMLTLITPRSLAKASVLNVYYDKSKVTPELIDRYFELTLREGNRQALVDRIQTELPVDAHEAISNIEVPTLVLWGKNDLLIPIENARRFNDDIPNSRLVLIDKCGHVPMEELPQKSLEPLKEFLKEN